MSKLCSFSRTSRCWRTRRLRNARTPGLVREQPGAGPWELFDPYRVRARYADFHLQRDDVTGARQLLDEAEQAALRLWKQGLETPLLPVELAAIRALQKDHDGAMEWLQRAYDSGWRMPWWIRLDPLLENLHADPRFNQLVGRMEDDVRRARERSTEVPELLRSLEQAAVQ
jgi:hypothetical protein